MSSGHALVTGGAGFIGAHLVQKLLASGRHVTVLDNLSVGRREAVPEGARFVHGDVRDESAVREALHDVDCVFHLAAQVTIRGSFDRFYDDLDTNVMGTARLLQCLDPKRVSRFVLASSMAVYADAASSAPIPETHPTLPLSPYGVGKLAAEGLARHVLAMRGIPLSVLRFFNTFGPGQTYTPYVGVITIFVTRLLRGEAPVVFGDGEQCRDFVHVDDLTDGVLAAASGPPGTYNLGTGQGTSLNHLADLLVDRLQPQMRRQHAPAQPGELRFSVADISRAREALRYRPVHTIADSLDGVIDDVRCRMAANDAIPR